MTITLIKDIDRYQGISTDSKPTSGIKKGSTFFEEDTGFMYRFTGSSWVAETAEVRLVSADGDVLYNKTICSQNQPCIL